MCSTCLKACQKVFKEVLLASEAGFKHVLEAQKSSVVVGYKNDSRKTTVQKHIEMSCFGSFLPLFWHLKQRLSMFNFLLDLLDQCAASGNCIVN